MRAAANREIRGMVARPGLIRGPGDHGHLSMIYRSVAGTGAACYVGEGFNTYSHVHVDYVIRLFDLVLDRPTRSLSPEERPRCGASSARSS
ncbi:hypothetical protein [Amycolatopsis sp. NPDC051061]|uniref:hypothetical protein n=1 Tax=Amycolatopsis sp. NPDC051061 TaxID=3155042 RepID=UPI00342D69EA